MGIRDDFLGAYLLPHLDTDHEKAGEEQKSAANSEGIS
jgi:hypothetical protein